MNKKLFPLGCMILLFCLSLSVAANESSPATVTIPAGGPVVDVCYSADGSKVVFAYENVINICKADGTLIKRFGIKDGPDIDVMDYCNNTIATFSYTPPAQINVWDENGTNIKKLGAIVETSDEAEVNPDVEKARSFRLLFSRDGKSIVNVSEADNFGGVKARDLATGKVMLLKGYSDDTAVVGCSFSVDGSKFVTISRSEQVRVWDLAKGTVITTIETGADPLNTSYDGKDVAFLSNGTFVVVKTDLELWSGDGKLIKTLKNETDMEYSMVRVSRDGNLFAVAYEDGGLAVYTKDGSLLKTFWTETDYTSSAVSGIAFSPDNKFVAVATTGGDTGRGDVRIFKL